MKKKLTEADVVELVLVAIALFMLVSAGIKISTSKYFKKLPPLPLSFSKLDKRIDKVYYDAFYELEYARRDSLDAEYNRNLDSIKNAYFKTIDTATFKKDSCYNLVDFYDRKLKLIQDSINNSLKIAHDTLNMDSVYNVLNIRNDTLKQDSVFNMMRQKSDTAKFAEQLRKFSKLYNNTLLSAQEYYVDALRHLNDYASKSFSYMDTHINEYKYPEVLLCKGNMYRIDKFKELLFKRVRFKHSLKNNEKKGR